MQGENEQPNGATQQPGVEDNPLWPEQPPQTKLSPAEPPQLGHDPRWMFVGPEGLRAGWSVLLFAVLMGMCVWMLAWVLMGAHLINPKQGFTPQNMFFNELAQLVALVAAASLMALIERRRLWDYNLAGARRTTHFFAGLGVGFGALSALVGTLAAGGWLHFHGAALNGIEVLHWGAFWGCLFLMVGCVEEGTFRCYLQSTLTRGLNFWWALGIVALACGLTAAHAKGNGVWGDYSIALLGIVPCYVLHRKAAPRSGFWQAAWVTSTLFGLAHTGNGGENWIGIFAAAGIGFVFCVSIRVTGSAWWAIGAHAGWDWGETFFYGTPNSGLVAKGHLLNTSPAGNVLWSGGSDGPEGSLLILGVILLLIVWLVAVYGRDRDKGTQEQEA